MKVVHYQDCISPHQMPLAREIAKRVGEDNFKYLYLNKHLADRAKLGWKMDGEEPWLMHIGSNPEAAGQALTDCDAMLIGYRDIDLIERMVKAGKRVFVQGERWFKGIHGFPGWVRMLHPRFRKMAKRFVKLVIENDNIYVLPIGVHAWNDMKWLGIPENKMMMWAYFVEPSSVVREDSSSVEFEARDQRPETREFSSSPSSSPSSRSEVQGEGGNGALRVLYVGRLLKLKHVDTVIKAVHEFREFSRIKNGIADVATLTIVGDGPEKTHLKALYEKIRGNSCNSWITFIPSKPISEIRQVMREHDVLVFASDASDGWGAVVSEALEEGVPVIGTYETGASATMLPESNLYHAGDYKALAGILRGGYRNTGIGEWSAAKGAERLLKLID